MKRLITSAVALLTLATMQANEDKNFNYHVDRFADIEVLAYEVPGFKNLTPQQRKLMYYLNEAALWGRDILWYQNCEANLPLRKALEQVYRNFSGDKNSEEYKAFEKYMKQIWFGNGIHHHYSMDKFVPEFSKEFLTEQFAQNGIDNGQAAYLLDVVFNPATFPKRVNQADGVDLIQTSACNFYQKGISQAEVENFYAQMKDTTDLTPISYGLNSRIVRDDNGNLKESVFKVGGECSQYIEKIIENLEKALPYAENDAQKKTIELLIDYYRTGDLKTFDEYSIVWAEDTNSQVDFINGFIESYGDPLGMKGSWEAIVNYKNIPASQRTETISGEAQWFEDHSPVDPRFRKSKVKGVSAKVINAAILSGDSYPSTPIGINLPNSNWIRAAHGSKSVTIENITEAYDMASHGNGFNEEFVIDAPTRQLLEDYLFITDNLHTDLHECLGHASGQLLPGVDPDALKAHGSTLEEARADLFALYYLADPKLLELGLLDNPEAYKAEYYKYILNGLMTQLMRIEPGKDIEEAHMRNRKLISEWAYEKGKPENVIEYVTIEGKTYIKINDYPRLRQLFGELLGEIQRIKSEGDYEAGRQLVEGYAVKVDPKIHQEVLDRYSTLDIAPYKGFVNPVYEPQFDDCGNLIDVNITYGEDYPSQMLRLSQQYSF